MGFVRALPLLLLLLCPLNTWAADVTFMGRARDVETGTLLYVESHAVSGSGGPRETRVVSEGLERGARGMTVFERGRGSPVRSKLLADADLVADAGFDEFVRARWNTLEAGDALVVSFLVPSRLDTVKFRVRKTGETTIEGQSASVFRLSVAGPLGWLLPDIDVSYRRHDRRLLRYRGITNLRDGAGDMISAQIDFSDSDRTDSAVDLEALRAQPLASSCGS
jgi:hypothetical protein